MEVDQTVQLEVGQLEPKDSVEVARPLEQEQEEEPFLPMVGHRGLGQPIEIGQTAKSQLMVGLRPLVHHVPTGLNLASGKGPWF